MERELLLEIGTEEIPASWLPALTAQIGLALEAKLKEARLSIDEPVQTYSTPRRLIAHAGRISERQTDLEELVTGPPVSAAFGADGKLTPAGAGFAKKQGVGEDQIERITTAKGEYIGVRKHQRGKTASDVLPDVLAGVLRAMSFPKQMRWDATLADGKGEFPALMDDELRPPEHQQCITKQMRELVEVGGVVAQCGRQQRQHQGGDDAEPAPRAPQALVLEFQNEIFTSAPKRLVSCFDLKIVPAHSRSRNLSFVVEA